MPELPLSGLAGYFDQDWLLLAESRNEDRNYTMGLALQASGSWMESAFGWLVDPLDYLTGLRSLHRQLRMRGGERGHTLVLGHGAFTPNELNQRLPIPDDRPYASLLYLTMSRATVLPHWGLVLRTETSVGVLGLRVGEWAQTRIHRWLRTGDEVEPYDPLGWPNQISDGGEPTLRYMAGVQYQLAASRWHDFSVAGEASLGYYTNAAAGGLLRFGWISSESWTVVTNPITAANQALGNGTGSSIRRPGGFEVYGFLSGRSRLVAYNALLEGQFRDSAVERPAWEVERVVEEFEVGVSAGWYGITATFMLLAGRTPEYQVAGVTPRTHTWGGLYLSWRQPPRRQSPPAEFQQ